MGGDGSIDVTVTGGNPAYTFDWDNNGTGDFDDPEPQKHIKVYIMKTFLQKSKIYSFIAFVCFFLCSPSLSIGQTWDEIIKLTASDGDEGDYFGHDVAIEGDIAVCSAVGHFPSDDASSVYVFRRVGDFWIEEAKLTASDAEGNEVFGLPLAIDSNRIAIVASKDNDFKGSVYVFEYIEEEWVETAYIVGSDSEASDLFGYSIDIDNDRIVVGAASDDDGSGSNSGSVYVFELIDGEYWIETEKLTASDADELDLFGSCIAISDDRLLIGANGNDDDGSNSGSAYIFNLEGDAWIETQKITASDADELDTFGAYLAISDDNLVVGAYLNDDDGSSSGSAYVFELVDEVWTETQKLTASDADELDYFGRNVAISGDYILIGAHRNDDDGSGSGSAYIFSTCPTLPEVEIEIEVTELCEGDTLTLTATGADTYFWEGDVEDGEPFVPEIGEYTYTVTGADDAGCENTASIDITVYAAIAITYVTTDEVFGDDGSIDITVSGGLPAYSFDWDNDGTGDFDDDEDLTGLTEGNYIVVVMCDAGCNGTEVIEVGSTQASIETNNEWNLSVSPNPTSDLVTITLEGSFVYSLVGVNGAVLATKKSVNQAQLDLSEFADGIYFLEIQSENGSETVKLVKQ